MNPTLAPNESRSTLGIVSLSLAGGGVILAVLIGFIAYLLHHDARMGAYFIFLAFEVTALSIGVAVRHQPLGRAGISASIVFLLLSLAFL